jgi:hypothetical protein
VDVGGVLVEADGDVPLPAERTHPNRRFNVAGATYLFTLATERRRLAAWFRPMLDLVGWVEIARSNNSGTPWMLGLGPLGL